MFICDYVCMREVMFIGWMLRHVSVFHTLYTVCIRLCALEFWSSPRLLALLIKSAIQIKIRSVFTADTMSKLKAEADNHMLRVSARGWLGEIN